MRERKAWGPTEDVFLYNELVKYERRTSTPNYMEFARTIAPAIGRSATGVYARIMKVYKAGYTPNGVKPETSVASNDEKVECRVGTLAAYAKQLSRQAAGLAAEVNTLAEEVALLEQWAEDTLSLRNRFATVYSVDRHGIVHRHPNEADACSEEE